ncbi:hypothetical protein CY34DRAFT_803150 [Suillus luteus UH-Slu-Lm8-n1]|uniref:Uncharacterized protein n=1 Tax=Suillus luteus UH-Slu-Lm8-n1 TaxID=930992 RepID=A0A0D0B1Z1_9AGAM|nr:hypothetical protein CY34DRAFT_803150 [Suillus luteus UH-Slu-Lm8-n1]
MARRHFSGLDTLLGSALFNVTTSDLPNFTLSKSTSISQQANLNTRVATQYSVEQTSRFHSNFKFEELWAMYSHMARMCRKFLCVGKGQNLRARVKDRFKAE